MEVHFRYDRDLEIADGADLRAITPRRVPRCSSGSRAEQWVKGPGKSGDAKVTVWPGPLPASAGGERVKPASSSPCGAAAKTDPAS